eukprot:6216403-Pyramimonas_sp.AAC.1
MMLLGCATVAMPPSSCTASSLATGLSDLTATWRSSARSLRAFFAQPTQALRPSPMARACPHRRQRPRDLQ